MNILETQEQLRDAKHVEGLQFKCGDCQQVKPVQAQGGTGYGYHDGSNRPVCYDCCGKRDREQMVKDGKATLYLTAICISRPFQGTAHITRTARSRIGHQL